MNGTAAPSESPLETPENILTMVLAGMALVTIAIANAMESTAPTFTTRVRAPLATPRFSGGTELIIAGVLGELKIPDPAPTTIIHTAISQYGVSTPTVVMPSKPAAVTSMPRVLIRRVEARSAIRPENGAKTNIAPANGVSRNPVVR